MSKFRIAITKTTPPKYRYYTDWLRFASPDIDFIDLPAAEDPMGELENAHGLLLPGGSDVHPARYGKEDVLHLCEDIDEARDQLELESISKALTLKLPILGICRGCQIANVALGGTLHFDLPSIGKTDHSKKDGKDNSHRITVDAQTHLASILNKTDGIVSSAHHQAADIVAPELRVSARTDDGIIEALEWKDPLDKSYLMLVQWHPERMIDRETNEYSVEIARDFLRAAEEFKPNV